MNSEIKEKIKAAGLHQYEVADLLGIGETTLVRWLRYELSPEKKSMILSAIEKGGKKNESASDNC